MLGEAPWAAGIELETIFLGGGTPSLLEPEDLAALLDTARARLAVAGDAEVNF